MPIWRLIPSAIQAGTAIYNSLNKPKASDFRNSEAQDALNRQMRRQETDIESQSVAKALARPAIRRTAVERERARRNILGSDLSPSAQAEAELRLSGQTQGAVTDILDRAGIAQLQSNQQSRAQLNDAEIRLAQLKDAERQRYKTAKQQQQANLVSNIGGAIGSLVTQYSDIADQDAIQNIINTRLSGFDEVNATPEQIDNLFNLIKLDLLRS